MCKPNVEILKIFTKNKMWSTDALIHYAVKMATNTMDETHHQMKREREREQKTFFNSIKYE